MTPGAWQLWQKPHPASQQWECIKSGRTSLKFVPFVTFAPGSVGFMEATPPLLDYAWENIGHWQSSSDQRNILHIARVPMWFGAGFKTTTEEGNQRTLRLAANSFVTSEDPNAKISIIETTGKAIEAGRLDVSDIEDRMSILGFEPLIKKNSNARATATGYMIDAEVEYSELSVWSMIFADCISQGIWMMSQYHG